MNNRQAMEWLEDLDLGVYNKTIKLDKEYVQACFKGHQALKQIEKIKKTLRGRDD